MNTTIDPEEIARFEEVAETWWDLDGPYKALHGMNPARIGYLRDQICFQFGRDADAPRPLEGLRILDIGCGGGLACEPLARLGAQVTGVDASAKNIAIAQAHAEAVGLDITYHAGAAETLIGQTEPYDVVTALEVVEHVADISAFLGDCRALLKEDGGFGYSTINKTASSMAVAKVGAEYIARLVPRGTHDWSKFVRPSDMATHLEAAGFEPWDTAGLVPDLKQRSWKVGPMKAINYIGWAHAA